MWDELTSFENLYQSYKKASKSRRSRPDIADFEISLEENLFELRDDLRSGVYEHGKYHSFHIHDPKKRLISAANFRDRIVHHAVVSVLEPIYLFMDVKQFFPSIDHEILINLLSREIDKEPAAVAAGIFFDCSLNHRVWHAMHFALQAFR